MKQGISFSILTHNRLQMLSQTMDSVIRGVNGGEFEIIVVDDGSTDGAVVDFLRMREELERGPNATGRFRVLRKDHDLQMPESWARNVTRGLEASQYDIVWHFDDDCTIQGPPGWANHVAHMLRTHRELGTLAPYRHGIMEPFVPWKDGIELSFGLTEPCFAMRREVFDQVGSMDENLRWSYGPDYGLRIFEHGYELAFWKGAKQIDLFPRTGQPTDTFPRADMRPYMDKWVKHYGVGEHAWPLFTRHRERVATQGKGKK